MLSLSVFPLIIIGISIAVFVAYMLFYMLRINKNLKHEIKRDEVSGLEENPKNKIRMPDTGSAGFIISVIAVAVCIVVGFGKLNSLKQELQNINDNYTRQIYALQDQLDRNYGHLGEMLKEKNSMFSSIDVKCGKYDKKTRKGEVIITVVPKTLTDDMKMTFNFGSEKFEGQRNGSAFVFDCRLDILKLYNAYEFGSYISVTAAGETKNEKTPETDEELMYCRFLPQIQVNYVYPAFYSSEMRFGLEADFCFNVSYENDIRIDSATICFEKNGELFKTIDVSSEFNFSQDTKEITVPVPSTKDFPTFSKGDEIKIYLVAMDSADVKHTCYMSYGKIENGSYIPQVFTEETLEFGEG